MTIPPLVILAIGIITVLGLIIFFRVNAFIALITAAVIVSLLAPGATAEKITRVAAAFGGAAGGIGIVIGLAAVIGKCMMDSGAADRVVRAFLGLLGEKRSPWALMGSGYVLAVPVFFDTVFYLLVPLARSFYRRTGGNYLKCILAIAAGGAITHTLVPPTPGPLLMAQTLGIDLGTMIMVGALVAMPAAVAGIVFAGIADKKLDIPMRQVDNEEPEQLSDDQLPSLFMSLLPVLLPVVMIAIHTIADTMSRPEVDAMVNGDWKAQIATMVDDEGMKTKDAIDKLKKSAQADGTSLGTWWDISQYTAVTGNPNLALLISTIIALWVLYQQRKPTLDELAKVVETSLMSGGVIILITAAGSAFGAMLKAANIGKAIEETFRADESGLILLFIGFAVAALLKIAQGSSTSAMIVGSAMLASMIAGKDLPYHPVYLATAIGSGSLIGSWMNDSGFWIFTKMGGLTEIESLKSWTILLIVLGLVSMTMTVILVFAMPMPLSPAG